MLRSLYKIDSRLTSFLKRKKKALEDALQSLGEHGLIHCVQEGEDLFYSLSDALRKELDRIITAAKIAVETADTVEPAMKPMKPSTLTKKSLAKRVAASRDGSNKRNGSTKRGSGAAGPSEQSHQHMLQLKYDEIQTRVKRNTRMLQTLHPIKQVQDMLNLLMSTLQRRINNDEVVLSQMSELKKGYQFDPHTNVADTLKMFIAGCDSVLYMMQTLNGIPPSATNAYDKTDSGSLVISMTNHQQESDQLSGSTSIASSATQQLQHVNSSLRRTNVRMFGDSRANSYTAADFRATYFHNQSPSPPKNVQPIDVTANDVAKQKQQVAIPPTRPQHLLYSAAASSASSTSPTPIKTASSAKEIVTNTSHQKPPISSAGISSSSGGGSSCDNSNAGSSSHSPVMPAAQSLVSAQNIHVASTKSVNGFVKKAQLKPVASNGDGAISEVSGYQSGHSSPVTSAKSGDAQPRVENDNKQEAGHGSSNKTNEAAETGNSTKQFLLL